MLESVKRTGDIEPGMDEAASTGGPGGVPGDRAGDDWGEMMIYASIFRLSTYDFMPSLFPDKLENCLSITSLNFARGLLLIVV